MQLELRYRPDDIYQHPILSRSVGVQNLVLKIDKNKRTGKTENMEIVGAVDVVHRFRGINHKKWDIGLETDIADMQYHPYPDSKMAKKFEDAFTDLNCIIHLLVL
jgi:Tau95 Triple barrel domain